MISQIYYKPEDYASEEAMYSLMYQQIYLLLKTHNAITLCNDKNSGAIILKFNYIDPSKEIEEQDTQFPYWLFPEESKALLELNKMAQAEAFRQMLEEADAEISEEDVDLNNNPINKA